MSARDSLSFSVPLPLAIHGTAQRFYQPQLTAQKAKQIYLNTLAVYAVNTYLSYLHVKTRIDAGDSWDPLMQSLVDAADLVVTNRGRLECRPVLPNASFCYVPPEVWHDRVGYVAVQFDPQLRYANLLGFLPYVDCINVPLRQWRSLEELIRRVSSPSPLVPKMNHLTAWLQGTIGSEWRRIEELIAFQQPALQFRSATYNSVVRGKYLSWDLPTGQQEHLVLIVGVMPSQKPEIDIWVKLCPQELSAYLPSKLEVVVLDEKNSAVMQAQSRQTEMIQLKFGGQVGEKFSIRVSLDESSRIESFEI